MKPKELSYYTKTALRMLKSDMPWELQKLRKKGIKFIKNYSNVDNTQLAILSTYEEKMGTIQVSDRVCEYAYTVEQFIENGIKNKNILDVGSSGSVNPVSEVTFQAFVFRK